MIKQILFIAAGGHWTPEDLLGEDDQSDMVPADILRKLGN